MCRPGMQGVWGLPGGHIVQECRISCAPASAPTTDVSPALSSVRPLVPSLSCACADARAARVSASAQGWSAHWGDPAGVHVLPSLRWKLRGQRGPTVPRGAAAMRRQDAGAGAQCSCAAMTQTRTTQVAGLAARGA